MQIFNPSVKILKSLRTLIFLVVINFSYTSIIAQNNVSESTKAKLEILYQNISEALESNDSLSIARAYYKLAIEYDYMGKIDSCDILYKKALSIAYGLNNNKAIAVISNSYATTLSDIGQHEEARRIYSEVADSFLELSDTSSSAGAMLNISSEYIDIGKYEKGLETAFDALKLKQSCSDSSNISAYYIQIGVLFNLIGNKQKWVEYILIADSLANKNDKYADFYRRMDILNELGSYYLERKNYKKAEQYYNRIFEESSENNYLKGISVSHSNLVSILKKQKKYSKALEYSKISLKLSESVNNIYHTLTSLIEISKLELLLKNNIAAKRSLLRARKLAFEFKYPNELIKAYSLLSEIYSSEKKYNKAYQYLLKYQALKDSINSNETQKAIAELETKYQAEKKDNQITLLNNENLLKQERIELQNLIVITVIVVTLLAIILFILLYVQNKLKVKNRLLDLNQKLLRTQMNPHFLFNALIAIQNYVLKNKKYEASDYLAKFASLTRTILEQSRQDYSILADEIELLKNYVLLQQLRYDNSFQFNLVVDEKINTEEFIIPPMIIQPFLENAIEHGLRKSTFDNKVLNVEYKLNENNLHIIIEDNGIGIENNSDENKKNHKSYATTITNERLLNITKLTKHKIEVEILDLINSDKGRGTQIKFILPKSLVSRGGNDQSNNNR